MASQYSVSDLESRAQAIISEVQSSKEPAFIAQNGRARVLMVDADTYLTQMQALHEFERIYRDECGIRPRTREGGAPAARGSWRCTTCGYTVQAEGLPEGFTCPTCGAKREQFACEEP